MEDKRLKQVYEYITTTHMFCLFIFVIALILSRDNIFPGNNFYPYANIGFFFFFCLLGIIAVISYITKIRLTQRDSNSLSYFDFIYLFIPLILAIAILFISHKDLSNTEAILLLPILITASIMGKKSGMIMASVCSFFLIFHELIQQETMDIYSSLESSLIYISLMYIVSWFIGGIADIETKHREHLTQIATTDILTGLYNHRYFQEKLKEYFQTVSDKNPLSLILIDIDHFKNYNDSFGHLEGDRVLEILGNLLKDNVKNGIAARYGGEEFVILLPGIDSGNAVQIAESIKKLVEDHKFYGEEYQPGGKMTVCCGIATSPIHGVSPEELIKRADYALYKAKSLNRNKVELYISVFEDLKLNDNEQESFNSIRTLVSIINAKDRYTFGHSERITDYCVQMAQRLQMSEKNIQLLKYAAFLHDVGKIEIEGYILNKPGVLNENDWKILKQHPRWGSDIVKSVSQLIPVSDVILYHHENYDGSGYPEGVKAENIPLMARIIRIADSYDAMTSNRIYKKNMTPSDAIEEIKRCSGTLYDPMLARLFIDVIYPEEAQQTAQPITKRGSSII